MDPSKMVAASFVSLWSSSGFSLVSRHASIERRRSRALTSENQEVKGRGSRADRRSEALSPFRGPLERVAAKYGQSGDDRVFAGDQYDKRSKEIFPFLYMIGVLGDAAIDAGWISPEQSVRDVSEQVASIKKQMVSCGLPFSTFTLGKMVVWIEAKEDNWIFLSAQPFYN